MPTRLSFSLEKSYCSKHTTNAPTLILLKAQAKLAVIELKNARCATRIHNKVSETFSYRKNTSF